MKSFIKKSVQTSKRITKFIAINMIKAIAKQIMIAYLFSSPPNQYLEPLPILPIEADLTEIEQS